MLTFKELREREHSEPHLCLSRESSALLGQDRLEVHRSRTGAADGLVRARLQKGFKCLISHRPLYGTYALYCLGETSYLSARDFCG